MDCAGIKALLSEYIDGTLDEKIRNGVEHHLSICRSCRQEWIALKTLVTELGSLGSEKAPEDFLEKVHQRIRATSKFERFVQFLFVPLRVKVPLEFTAALVSVGLIFFVFHINPPVKKIPAKKIAEISKMFNAVEIAEETQFDHVAPAFEKEAVKASPKRKAAKLQFFKEAGKSIELAIYIRPKGFGRTHNIDTDLERPEASAESSAGIKTERLEALPRPKSKLTIQSAPSRAEKGERKREGKDLPSAEFVTILAKIENLIETLGGKTIYVESNQQNRFPTEILANFDRKYYSLFGEKLEQIVDIQTSLPSLPDDNTRDVQIRILIISK